MARGKIISHTEALKTTEAVLETLGERLYKTERESIASELPKDLKKFLVRKKEALETSRENKNRYGLQEFYNRVGERAEVSHRESVECTKVVVSVLKTAVSSGVLNKAVQKLPEEYRKLFE
jgi:uncharacterized protein (DUF2267 family)